MDPSNWGVVPNCTRGSSTHWRSSTGELYTSGALKRGAVPDWTRGSDTRGRCLTSWLSSHGASKRGGVLDPTPLFSLYIFSFFDAAGLFNCYRCFYLLRSKELVSPVCGLFILYFTSSNAHLPAYIFQFLSWPCDCSIHSTRPLWWDWMVLYCAVFL